MAAKFLNPFFSASLTSCCLLVSELFNKLWCWIQMLREVNRRIANREATLRAAKMLSATSLSLATIKRYGNILAHSRICLLSFSVTWTVIEVNLGSNICTTIEFDQ
jgi:hypothetical protein